MIQKLLGKGFAFRNNYLTAVIILLFLSFSANAQWTRPNTSFGSKSYRASHDSTLLFPTGCGTPSLRLAGGSLSGDTKKAALFFDSCGAVFYRYDPAAATWAAVGGVMDTSSKWINRIYRSNDSVFTVKGGTATFAYIDSVGSGGGGSPTGWDDMLAQGQAQTTGRDIELANQDLNIWLNSSSTDGAIRIGSGTIKMEAALGGQYIGIKTDSVDISVATSSDTSKYKPLVASPGGGVAKLDHWPVGSGGGSGGTDNLNDVAGRDSNTVHSLKVQGNYKYVGVESLSAFGYAFLNHYPGSGGFLSLANPSGYGGYLYADLLTTDREFRFPDTSGTLVSRVKVNGTTYNSSTKGTVDLGTISGGSSTDSAAIHLLDGITSPSTYVLKFSNLNGDTTTVTIDTTGLAGNSQWDTTGLDIYNNNGGNVLIGTTTPITYANLEVAGDLSSGNTFYFDASSGDIRVIGNGVGTGIQSDSATMTTTIGDAVNVYNGTYISVNDDTRTINLQAANGVLFSGNIQADTINVSGKVTGSLAGGTGLPISTGVSGLGSNVATFLATPSSANFASAITDETGSGVAVFGTSPTFTTDLTSPKIIGGTGTTSTLTLQTTTGVGTTNADIIFKVGNNGATEGMRIANSGAITLGGALTSVYNATYNNMTLSAGLAIPKTITAGGTTGAQTINKISGAVNFAAGASTLVVTNSHVSSTSLVLVQVYGTDATATSARVTLGSGSFTITLNAAATAETKVGFFVTN